MTWNDTRGVRLIYWPLADPVNTNPKFAEYIICFLLNTFKQ